MSKNFYAEDVARLAAENEDYRRVLYTTDRSQLVLMAVQPGDEIGEETHEGIDQVLAFVAGEGEAVVDRVGGFGSQRLDRLARGFGEAELRVERDDEGAARTERQAGERFVRALDLGKNGKRGTGGVGGARGRVG